mmetsp:Transcript_1467/g.3247  ORF Transcript_1467/g.3247 Transcript_1467/m.3247 type:complete len:112 (+) Transcript_1467:73-408(+)
MLKLLLKKIVTTIEINGRKKMMKPVKLLMQTIGMDDVFCYFSSWWWLAVKVRHHSPLETGKSELRMKNLHQKHISVFRSCYIHPRFNQFVTHSSGTAHNLLCFWKKCYIAA